MDQTRIEGLVEQLRAGHLSRRQFVTRAMAIGMSAAAASAIGRTALGQEAPAAATEPVLSLQPGQRSINREEFDALLRESFELEEPQVQGGQIIYGETTDIQTLNPILSGDVYSGFITGFMFNYLIGTSPTNGLPIPDLADYFELAEDGLTYTFYINANATWHDGQPVTADDVVFSFDSTVAEGSLSPRAASVSLIVDSYRAVDEKTFEITTKEVFATALTDAIGLVGIVPKHIWEGVEPASWGADPGATGQDPARVVGSGPFKFREWVTSDHVTVVKNAEYWDTLAVPVIDEFTLRVIPEPSANVQALQAGETDIIELDAPQVAPLQGDPNLTITPYDDIGFNWYSPNQDPARSPLFTEIPVRQALMYALDRELMAESIYLGFAARAIGTQSSLSIAYRPEEVNTDYTYQPDMARQLLEEAGWVDSDGDGIREKDGVRFSFECLFSEGVATYEQQLPYMQQAWREVGIEMIPAAVPFTALSDGVDTGNFQMAVYGFSWTVDGGQGDMYRCDAVPEAGFNTMRYCNPKYDELDAQQRAELDQEARIAILLEQTNIVNDEQANGVLLFRQTIAANSNRVHNHLPNGYVTWWSLPYVWADEL
jgi:peptide/nickel transport system substrate-binding protein